MPQALRTSINLFTALLARIDSSSAIGERNAPIKLDDNDDCNIKFDMIGGE